MISPSALYPMLSDPKDDKLSPKLIGCMLILLSFIFLILGGIQFLSITSTYYFNGENASGTVKSIERNQWPRFRTYNYGVEFHDAENQPITAHATAKAGVMLGSTVEIIYSKNHPEEVYFSGAYLPAISYSLGILALGLFISTFGLSQLFVIKEAPTAPITRNLPIAKSNMPPAIRFFQNILIILLMACLIGYLVGGSNA